MSKQIMKPVWRVRATGNRPNDLGSSGLFYDGELFEVKGNYRTSKTLWMFMPEGVSEQAKSLDVVAYETTRTKAAKYTHKDCQVCEGKGNRNLKDWITKTPFTGVCIYCDGKGYKLEAIK